MKRACKTPKARSMSFFLLLGPKQTLSASKSQDFEVSSQCRHMEGSQIPSPNQYHANMYSLPFTTNSARSFSTNRIFLRTNGIVRSGSSHCGAPELKCQKRVRLSAIASRTSVGILSSPEKSPSTHWGSSSTPSACSQCCQYNQEILRPFLHQQEIDSCQLPWNSAVHCQRTQQSLHCKQGVSCTPLPLLTQPSDTYHQQLWRAIHQM